MCCRGWFCSFFVFRTIAVSCCLWLWNFLLSGWLVSRSLDFFFPPFSSSSEFLHFVLHVVLSLLSSESIPSATCQLSLLCHFVHLCFPSYLLCMSPPFFVLPGLFVLLFCFKFEYIDSAVFDFLYVAPVLEIGDCWRGGGLGWCWWWWVYRGGVQELGNRSLSLHTFHWMLLTPSSTLCSPSPSSSHNCIGI